MSEAADHIRAAADCLEDAMTYLNRASQATDSSMLPRVCDRMRDVLDGEAGVLRGLAINAEVMEEFSNDE